MMAATTPTSSAVMPMLIPSSTSTPMPQAANATIMPISSVRRFHWYRAGAADGCMASEYAPPYPCGSGAGGDAADGAADRPLHQRAREAAGEEEVGGDRADLRHHDAAGELDSGAVHVGRDRHGSQRHLPAPGRLLAGGQVVTQQGERLRLLPQ